MAHWKKFAFPRKFVGSNGDIRLRRVELSVWPHPTNLAKLTNCRDVKPKTFVISVAHHLCGNLLLNEILRLPCLTSDGQAESTTLHRRSSGPFRSETLHLRDGFRYLFTMELELRMSWQSRRTSRVWNGLRCDQERNLVGMP